MNAPDEVVFSEVIEVSDNDRTSDVLCDGSFKSLLLSQITLDNLIKHGFKKPSPVQLKAIPPGMAGIDMLVQAKSGTGKTLVFAILAAENLKLSSKTIQKLVIAPTREIALQIGETVMKLAPRGAKIAVLTGGSSVYEDKEKLKKGVHIIVGTTGRLCQLVNEDSLNLSSLSLFVLDEADKMMSGTFEKDVNFLYSCIPPIRQVAVFSATYPSHLASALAPFLRSPTHIRLNSHDVQLIGVKQYVSVCFGSDPIDVSIAAFASIQFKQAFLFCNRAEECSRVVDRLIDKGIEAAAISAQLEQSQREDVIKRLKTNKIKVVVSTDLTARGVDADGVDLVINMDSPFEVETYLHRIGRAARYGGQGASLTILPTKKSLSRFAFLVGEGGIKAKEIKIDTISPTLTTDRSFFDSCPLFISERGTARNGVEEEYRGKEEDENIEPIEKENNGNMKDEQNKLAPDYSMLLDKALELSSTLKKNNVTETQKGLPEEKKKFKFVPSRNKKSTKYYMKGEMIAIRNSLTVEQWKDYASGKFDLTQEPFTVMPCPERVHKPNESRERGKPSLGLRAVRDGIKEYTRKDMIAISKAKPAKVWRAYAECRWNLNEDPFVEEQWMRCSFTDRIRLQRQKEKAERDKVVAERNAARIRLISMGTNVSMWKEWEGSFEDYCAQMKKEMETKGGQRRGERRGAVVSKRRDKEEYRKKVEETRSILDGVEKKYEYALNIALRGIKEGGTETDIELIIEDMNIEHSHERAMREEKEETIQEGVAVEDTEDGKEEEKEWTHGGDEEAEGAYDDEEDEEEAETGENGNMLCASDDHSVLFSSYNRNIEFVRVFNAYLNSMSTMQ